MITKVTIKNKNYYTTLVNSWMETVALENEVYKIPATIRHSFKRSFDGNVGKWRVSWMAIR